MVSSLTVRLCLHDQIRALLPTVLLAVACTGPRDCIASDEQEVQELALGHGLPYGGGMF